MSAKRNALILCGESYKAEKLQHQLEEADFETHVSTAPGEAVKHLREHPYDALIVGNALQKPTACDFLAKAAEFVPRVLRIICEEKLIDGDFREMVNTCAPCAIIDADYADVKRIIELIDQHRKMLSSSRKNDDAIYTHRDMLQFKARVTKLERENARLVRNLQRQPRQPTGQTGQSGVNPFAPPPKPKEPPAPPTHEEVVQQSFKADPVPDAVPEETPTAQAEATAQPEVPQPSAKGIDHLREGQPTQAAPKEIDPKIAEIITKLDMLVETPDIQLPVLPALGMEVQQLVASDNTSFDQIAEKVALDPSMSARILEVANSPLYAGIEPVRSIQNAVGRIGMRETRNILQAVLAEGLFQTKNPALNELMGQLWMHSLAVAYGNEIIAKTLFIEESSDFFMMGLLHDIGKLLILHLIQEGIKQQLWSKEEMTRDVIVEVFRTHHNTIGLFLMEKWEYPDSFHSVVELHNDNQNVYQYEEPVVVTYYANLLSRKVGLSLEPHDEELLANKQIAQSLNMSEDARTKTSETLGDMVDKIKQSYLK